MGIVATLVAAMGAIGVLLWRLNQASDAAKGVMQTAEDTRGFFRRMAWRRKSGKNPLDTLTDPREAAVTMMAAVAQWDAAMSDREMTAIKAQITQHFQASDALASELLATGRWLARDVTDLGAFLRRASPSILAKCTPKERSPGKWITCRGRKDSTLANATRDSRRSGGASAKTGALRNIPKTRRSSGVPMVLVYQRPRSMTTGNVG